LAVNHKDTKKRYIVFACRVSLFCKLVLVSAYIACPVAFADRQEVADLLSIAQDKGLFRDRYWHILMHYEKTLFGVNSNVDDPSFFIAPDGKTNPQSELEATISALFQEDDKAAEPYVCRFYGRFMWLKQALMVDSEMYANRMCAEIDNILPVSATLVFPTYYMNNPASMFGHTLLTISTEYKNRRLAYAVNYAAQAGNTVDGLSFAVNGLFGLYKGYYSVEPYYKKIQEYGDIHHRDIWEYTLNLTPEELKWLIRHVKELNGVYTDYFFFDENCSFNLLFLIEAARPSVDLVSQFQGPFVFPLDTIKSIKSAGLIMDERFRPSKVTRIRHLIESLDDPAIDSAAEIIRGRISPMDLGVISVPHPPDQQAKILDLAAEQLQYLYVKKTIDKKTYQERFLETLRARSRLGVMSAENAKKIPIPPRPERGHDSKRISLVGGLRDGNAFCELRFRPAFTDLLDMDYIHQQGAQIEFGDARLRYFFSNHRFQLQQIDIIDIISISGRDAFFKPLSWKVDTGFHRKPIDSREGSLFYRLNTGTGLAVDYPFLGLSYAMVTGEVDFTGALKENFALGPGLICGMVKKVAPFLKSHLYGEVKWFMTGDSHTESAIAFSNNLKVSKNNHFSVELKWEHVRHWESMEASGVWHFFF